MWKDQRTDGYKYKQMDGLMYDWMYGRTDERIAGYKVLDINCYFSCSVCRKVSEGVSHRFTLFFPKRTGLASDDAANDPLEQRFKAHIKRDTQPQNDDVRLNHCLLDTDTRRQCLNTLSVTLSNSFIILVKAKHQSLKSVETSQLFVKLSVFP